MTWNNLLADELARLHAYEQDVVPTLERLRGQVRGAAAHEALLQLLDAAPGRLTRLEVAMGLAGVQAAPHEPAVIAGWTADVDALVDHLPRSAALDAAILVLILKVARLRTAGYEAAYLLAATDRAEEVAGLLRPLWTGDVEADERTSDVLAALVASGGEDWDAAFRRSQQT